MRVRILAVAVVELMVSVVVMWVWGGVVVRMLLVVLVEVAGCDG